MLPKSSSKISCIKLALLSSAFSKLLKVVLFKVRLPSVVVTNTRKPRQNKAKVFRKDIIDAQNRKLFFSAVIDSQDIQNYCSVPPYCCTLIWLLQNWADPNQGSNLWCTSVLVLLWLSPSPSSHMGGVLFQWHVRDQSFVGCFKISIIGVLLIHGIILIEWPLMNKPLMNKTYMNKSEKR